MVKTITMGAIPFLSVTANLNNKDLGTATADVKAAIQSIGRIAPRINRSKQRVERSINGYFEQSANRIAYCVVVIFLMLAANFQSFKVSLVILSTVPAVMLGFIG